MCCVGSDGSRMAEFGGSSPFPFFTPPPLFFPTLHFSYLLPPSSLFFSMNVRQLGAGAPSAYPLPPSLCVGEMITNVHVRLEVVSPNPCTKHTHISHDLLLTTCTCVRPLSGISKYFLGSKELGRCWRSLPLPT
jgi:hypothetical protein